MTYSKPEVKSLGEAKMVIEKVGKQQSTLSDGQPFRIVVNPAYDLDE